MPTTTRIPLLLAALFAAASGCDDEFDPEFPPDDEEITERCVGTNCTVGGIGNTSRIGDHALSNLAMTFNKDVANISSKVRITGAYGYYGSTLMSVTAINVRANGELQLQLGTAGWIMGTAVKNAYFNVVVTPSNGKPAFSGKLLVADVECAPGKLDQAMNICKYEMVTNVKPGDTTMYPMHTKLFGYYHTCPNEDEGGALSPFEKYAAVLSPQSTLVAYPGTTPRIDASPGMFIFGCINGAVSKGQYYLNAFYDASATRGLDPSQRSAMLLMWMAWYDGASRTEPGKQISPHDPIKGLFTWTGDQTWDLEGGYGATGATCRGGPLATGLHRKYVDPVATIPNWGDLPHCDASDIGSMAVLGVKVAVPQP